MAVIAFVVCDICGNPIDPEERITVVYGGTLNRVEGGRAIVHFADTNEAEPLHHHEDCHEQTHAGAPAEAKGIVH